MRKSMHLSGFILSLILIQAGCSTTPAQKADREPAEVPVKMSGAMHRLNRAWECIKEEYHICEPTLEGKIRKFKELAKAAHLGMAKRHSDDDRKFASVNDYFKKIYELSDKMLKDVLDGAEEVSPQDIQQMDTLKARAHDEFKLKGREGQIF